MISSYTKTDGLLAIALYVLLLIAYFLMGLLNVYTGIYLGVLVNLALIALCAALALVRKQKLASVGFTLHRIGASLIAGAVSGVVFAFFMNVLPILLEGGRPVSVGQALYNVFYYFIVIGLSEEVVFRGYIQTRLYGFIKNDIAAVLLSGILFYAMHLPYQMVANGLRIDLRNMAILFALHIIMNFLYRKYKSLAAPTVFHGLLDWGGIFLR
jgi:membrane protease YdiL (CAAX protease family)